MQTEIECWYCGCTPTDPLPDYRIGIPPEPAQPIRVCDRCGASTEGQADLTLQTNDGPQHQSVLCWACTNEIQFFLSPSAVIHPV